MCFKHTAMWIALDFTEWFMSWFKKKYFQIDLNKYEAQTKPIEEDL